MIEADARSFTVQELEARLRPFVKRRVSDCDVDDVMQDIFLRVQRGLPNLRDEERFGPWVYQIARSAVADSGRARARSHVAQAPDEVMSPAPEEDDGAARMLARAVAPFVALLPPAYREAVALTELEGMSQREAAARLGITTTAMKSRIRRGRAQLRALLEACCEIALDARGHVVACASRDETKCECLT